MHKLSHQVANIYHVILQFQGKLWGMLKYMLELIWHVTSNFTWNMDKLYNMSFLIYFWTLGILRYAEGDLLGTESQVLEALETVGTLGYLEIMKICRHCFWGQNASETSIRIRASGFWKEGASGGLEDIEGPVYMLALETWGSFKPSTAL
jgi:hypothetical protein